MNTPHLTVQTVRLKCDITGRYFIRFIPTFYPDCTASGSLTFAVWEASEDDPIQCQDQLAKAIANAKDALSHFSDTIRNQPFPAISPALNTRTA